MSAPVGSPKAAGVGCCVLVAGCGLAVKVQSLHQQQQQTNKQTNNNNNNNNNIYGKGKLSHSHS